MITAFKRLYNKEDGNILVIVAASLVALLMIMAVVIDVGNLFFRRVHMQNAADAAALAAVVDAKLVFEEEYKIEFYMLRDDGTYAGKYQEYLDEGFTEDEAEDMAYEFINDAADLIAELAAIATNNPGDRESIVTDYLQEHGLTADVYDSGSSDLNGYEVTVVLQADEPLFFGSLVGLDNWNLQMEAGAEWEYIPRSEREIYEDDPRCDCRGVRVFLTK